MSIREDFTQKKVVADYIQEKRIEKKWLETYQFRLKLYGMILIGSGLLLLVVRLIKVSTSDYITILSALMFIAGVILSLLPPGPRSLEEVKEEIGIHELALSKLDKNKDKADYLFRQHQRDLKKYYDQILTQNHKIFAVGIGCIASGLGICLYVLNTIHDPKIPEFSGADVLIAGFGAIASISVNFIGALYLKMFSEIAKSTGEFHKRLVGTHNIHFANLFASQLEVENDRKDAVKNIINGLVESFVLSHNIFASSVNSVNESNCDLNRNLQTKPRDVKNSTSANEGFATDEVTTRNESRDTKSATDIITKSNT